MSTPLAKPRRIRPGAKLIDVTPELAMDWLTQPTYRGPNRRLSQEWVSELARRMREGRWQVTGETIKFGESGHLIDGQHRLHACVEANVMIQTYVAWGIEDEAQDVMDAGRKRTAADALSIRNVPNYGALAASAKVLIRIQRGAPESRIVIGTDEVVEFINAHPQFVEIAGNFLSTRIGLPPAVWLSAMLLAYQRYPEKALSFNAACASGAGLEPGNAALALRERTMQIKINREHHSPWALLSAVLRCFDLWQRGKHLQKVQLYKAGVVVTPPVSYLSILAK